MCGWLELQIIESAILLTMHEVSSIRLQSIACILLWPCKAHNEPVQSYAPVVKALFTIDDREKSRLMKKFDICYVLAREGIAFNY